MVHRESLLDPFTLTLREQSIQGQLLGRLDAVGHDLDWPMYALNLSVLMRTVATELRAPAAADQAIELDELARQRLPAEHRERAGTARNRWQASWANQKVSMYCRSRAPASAPVRGGTLDRSA